MIKFTAFEITATAKINFNLHITGKREDGYHLLDSLVGFVDIGDTLHFAAAEQYTLTITGPYAERLKNLPIEQNLISKAVTALSPALPAISITLTKNLPVASGIGGGSADAAATLRGLARILNIPKNDKILYDTAKSLGADVPMCLKGKSAIAQGIGEKLHPVQLPALSMLLVNPGIPISTPAVFQEYAKKPSYKVEQSCKFSSNLNEFIQYLQNTENSLQPYATKLCPEILNVINNISTQNGCLLSRMSGSGATCFGVFENEDDSKTAQDTLQKQHPGWWSQAVRLI